MATCSGKRSDGEACGMHAGANGWCWNHDPAKVEARAASRQAGGKARMGVASSADEPSDSDWEALEGNPCDHPEAIETALTHVAFRVATGKLTPAAARVITAALSKTADLLIERWRRHYERTGDYRSEPWSAWKDMERERNANALGNEEEERQ